MFDVIVVGAGIGGLSAAIALGARGQKVLLLEADSAVGGKAGALVLDGVEVDTGPSVLTMPDVFETLFGLAAMRFADQVKLLAPCPAFRYLYPDGATLDVHHELEDTVASVRTTLGSGPAHELESFMEYAATIWRAAAPAFVYGDAPHWKTILGGGLRSLGQLARVDAMSTMWGAIRRRVKSPHLRTLLARYATYNGSDVRRAPATLNCISHVELAMGGFGIEGGMYALVRALERAALGVGVVIECDARVARVMVDGDCTTGVELLDGRRHRAPCVVINADVAAATSWLLDANVDHGVRNNQAPSMSGLNLIVKARNVAPRAAHTVVFPQNYMGEFADIFDHDRAPRDPTVYLCAQGVCHERKTWPGYEPLFLMANAPPEPKHGARDPAAWHDLEVGMLRRAKEAGLVGEDDRVLWRRTPQDLAARFPGSRGSIYGSASNTTMAAFARPANRVPGVAGLFLASGSAHPGGGVPLAALSGIAAARAITAGERWERTG